MKKTWPFLLLAAVLVTPLLIAGALLARGRASVPEQPPLVVPASPVPPDPTVWPALEALPGLVEEKQGAALDTLYRGGALSFPIAGWDEPGNELLPVITLLKERADAALLLEDDEAALRQVMSTLAWGLRIKDAEGSLVEYMAGISVASHGLERLRELLEERPQLREPARELLLGLPIRQAATRALTVECEGVARLFEDEEALLGAWNSSGVQPPRLGQRWLVDGHANAAWQRAWCREVLAQVALPPARRQEVQTPAYWEGAGPERFVHNPGGRVLMDIAVPDYMSFVAREDELLEQLEALTEELAQEPRYVE